MFQIEEGLAGQTTLPRVRAKGRYLFAGDTKFFVKGVTYGPFPENSRGEPLPEDATVLRDFELMRRAGVNAIRVYYVPPRHFLDLAAKAGIRVMVGIPWPQHLCFLDQWEVKEDIKKTVRESVASLAGHPAILAWLIGNEIPSHIVRWHGAGKVEKFLAALAAIVREEDPEGMVTYANYPSTEYLRLPFLDFLSVNVYLHDPKAFRSYVKRLQNVAGELPLVLSEFGMDSIRNSEEHVAETLAWQLRAAYELGVSGTMVFAWTDEWYTGGHLIEDWKFGLVNELRRAKPAYQAVADVYRQKLPLLPQQVPAISVVVCAYNAASTMDGCLASFAKVDYPDFEVIVVDDGSTDETGAIADRHAAAAPYIHVIHQPNLGLSAARNVGMRAARGEIVAYTDSDCYVDPHWLHYMAWAFTDDRFVAVGGPNLPPAEDNRTAACVAVSPGAPTHVLLTDEIAEHVPGCNMAYRKEYLAGIGGFDATYRAAGDDVDVCWRLQDDGHLIGFSAACSCGTTAAAPCPPISSSRRATAGPRRCFCPSTRPASTCSAIPAGPAASTATSPARCSPPGPSSTTAPSAPACSRRSTNPRAAWPPTCPCPWSGWSWPCSPCWPRRFPSSPGRSVWSWPPPPLPSWATASARPGCPRPTTT